LRLVAAWKSPAVILSLSKDQLGVPAPLPRDPTSLTTDKRPLSGSLSHLDLLHIRAGKLQKFADRPSTYFVAAFAFFLCLF
jgi:hypothetical protein